MATTLIRRDPGLARIYAVRQLLAKATTIPDVKSVRDAAEAAEIYARRQQLGEEMENFAYKIKMLALAKLGTLIRQAHEADQLNQGTRGHGRPRVGGTRAAPPKDPRRTLADLHLTKKLSSAAQQFSRLSPKERDAVANRAKLAFSRHCFGTISIGERATCVRLGVARLRPRCAPAAS